MPTPSLLIVPARFKTGKLYSQIPTSGAGDFTVTRNTEARRFDSAGLVASVASGIPRLDYYTSGGVTGCPALLVEPSATNLSRYSEQFDTVTSGWTANGLQTITGNTTATLDPAGGNTADLIVATTGTTNHDIRPSANNYPAFVSGTTYTYSVFAKATSATSGFVQLLFGAINFSPSSPYANFQLSGNGAITTGTYSAASIQPFGNGWYRCSITATAADNGNATNFILPILASGTARAATFAGNGVDGVYLWGAQLETGSVATSYIPTTTGTGSRSADVISVSGAVSGSIGQTEGTLYVEVDYRNFSTSSQAILHLFQNGNNLIGIQVIRSGANNQFQAYAFVAGSLVVSITSTISTAGVYKIALGYNLNDYALYINGTLIGADSSAGVPTTSQVLLGHYASQIQFNDRIRAAALYTTRLTNAELATLTTP